MCGLEAFWSALVVTATLSLLSASRPLDLLVRGCLPTAVELVAGARKVLLKLRVILRVLTVAAAGGAAIVEDGEGDRVDGED